MTDKHEERQKALDSKTEDKVGGHSSQPGSRQTRCFLLQGGGRGSQSRPLREAWTPALLGSASQGSCHFCELPTSCQ